MPQFEVQPDAQLCAAFDNHGRRKNRRCEIQQRISRLHRRIERPRACLVAARVRRGEAIPVEAGILVTKAPHHL